MFSGHCLHEDAQHAHERLHIAKTHGFRVPKKSFTSKLLSAADDLATLIGDRHLNSTPVIGILLPVNESSRLQGLDEHGRGGIADPEKCSGVAHA